jgi:hypothetical protein
MQSKKNTKRIVLILLLLLVGLAGYWLMNKIYTSSGSVANKGSKSTSEELSFKLEAYPEEVVPIYQLSKIESFKYFVNDDPQNYAGFFDANKNYFNVVFETTATQEELLSYYRSLMTSVNDEYENSTSVEGVIGEYKVSASHYGEDTDTAYLQVYLPTSSYSKENPYFKDFPKIVEVKEDWVLHETSYGLLNQKGGEIEFTAYYTVDSKQMEALFDEYQQIHAGKEAFIANPDSGMLQWMEDGYEVSLVFSADHGRVYLMIRTPMK